MINKDTIICCSFAKEAGNTGCFMYNNAFKHLKLNYIYKSFSIDDIGEAINAAKILKFKGMSITMPFKQECLAYIDYPMHEVNQIKVANTILNKDGKLLAYNTDTYSSFIYLSKYKNKFNTIYILGNGGFSKAVQYSSKKIFKNINLITRKNWKEINNIYNSLIFNCTPVNIIPDISNIYIDCNVKSKTGKELALLQASKQFEIYTNKKFPIKYIKSIYG